MADTTEPNLFELDGHGVTVTYATSSFEGPPQFSIRGEQEMDASGDQINVQATDLGTEVTILVTVIPDAETVTVTLLVPAVNLKDGAEADVSTSLIETTTRTSIGGPRLVDGQRQTYRVIELTGTARFVEF